MIARILSTLAIVATIAQAGCGGGGGSDPGPGRDTTPPNVVGIAPASGSSAVSRSAAITVTFDEPVASSSITSATVTLQDQGGAPVAWAKALDASGKVLTITPSSPLANFTSHTVTVTRGVTDVAQNPLAAIATATFKTADDVAPVLAGGVTVAGSWSLAPLTFGWGAASDDGSGMAGYEVAVATAPDPAAVVASAAPAASPYVFDAAGRADGEVFYTRVRALDVAGNASAWSAWSAGVALDAAAPSSPGAPTGPGAYALASPVSFAWTAATDVVSGVNGYLAQVVTATDGSGTTLFDGPVASGLHVDVAASEGQHLFARAAAVDRAGFTGPWSAWSSGVTVDLTAPTAPGTPAHSGATSGSPVTFGWTAAADGNGIASYVLHVATAADGSGTLFQGDLGSAALTHDFPAADGALIYARVAAVDVAGRQGAWSPFSSGVRVDVSGPTAPGKPLHAGAYDDASVPFSWTASTDAWSAVASYRLEVSAAADFSSGVVSSDVGLTTSAVFDASGRDGQKIYARVRAVDALGNTGSFSPVSDGVTVDAAPPTVPGTPLDGGSSSFEHAVHFDWAASSDPVTGVASYTIEIAASAGGPAIHTGTSAAPSYDFDYGGALPATLYARVRATDAVGNASAFSGWSDGITITNTAPGKPATPTELPPAVYTSSTSITFGWLAPTAGGPWDEYVVQIGTTPGGNDVVANQVQPGAIITIAGVHGQTYYVRVAARDSVTGIQGAFSAASDGVTVDTTPPSAPGTPTPRGATDDRYVTFLWGAATDAESGIAGYQLRIWSGGVLLDTALVGTVSYTFDAAGHNGDTLTADVSAINGAGTPGPFSLRSEGVLVDMSPPGIVSMEPWFGSIVPTNTDVVIHFSEPMDQASVEAAFSLKYGGGGGPKNGYVFTWSSDGASVSIVPDTQDPVGATNLDLLPEQTAIQAVVAGTATDLAGNPLTSGMTVDFSTMDETPPSLPTLTIAGASSPVPAAAVSGAFTMLLAFTEDMDPTHGGVRITMSQGRDWIEARHQSDGVVAAVAGAGSITYTLSACADIRVGDVVSVRDVLPLEYQVTRATVTGVNMAGPCTFTVSGSAGGPFQSGGWVAYPAGNGARPRWTGPRTMAVDCDPWPALVAGSEAELYYWDLNDLSWNRAEGSASLQVAAVPGADTTPPVLIASVPRAGATAPGMRPVMLRFSEPLDRGTLAGISADCAGCAGAYAVQYSNQEFGPMVVLTPRRSPPAGASVTVHVPGTVRDLGGNSLGADAYLNFTVGASNDLGAPRILETLPASGQPSGSTWDAEIAFEDSLAGVLDPLDATSVGPEDVRVTDDTGRMVRGWRTEVDPGSAFLRLHGRASGLQEARQNLTVTQVVAVAASGQATYTTATPHGMSLPGARVGVWMAAPADQRFSVNSATVVAIPSPTQFALAWAGGDDATSGTGLTNVPQPRSYTIELLGIPGAGTITDAFGNALAPQSFTVAVQPWPNRAPSASSLRDVQVRSSTSAGGRTLEAEVGVQDPDGGTVAVSVQLYDGATPVSLPSFSRTVDLGATWGTAWYRVPLNGGGPPFGNDPPELAALGASGNYPIAITLSDGVASTTYLRDLWIWAPGDAPVAASVVDGGVTLPMDSTHPPLVLGASPAFRWTNVDVANADLLGFYVASLDGVGDRATGYREAQMLPADESQAAGATPLPADVYLWTVVQQRLARGSTEPRSTGWSLDVGDLYRSLFVVGPGNGALSGSDFGGARIGFRRDVTGALLSFTDATGIYSFEPGPTPVFAAPDLRGNNGGTVLPVIELFAAGAGDGSLVMTQFVESPDVPLPLPMRGLLGRGGELFAVAQANELAPTMVAGARRHAVSGFGPTLSGTFAFVQMEAQAGVGTTLSSLNGSVGTATFEAPGTGQLAVEATTNEGVPMAFATPYGVDPDGRLSIDIGSGAIGPYARGYLGGAAGAEIAVLASDNTPDRLFWLLLTRARVWTGTETNASIAGSYRVADLSALFDGTAGTLAFAEGASGILTFDGAGGYSYQVQTSNGTLAGTGTYAVDPVSERINLASTGAAGPATLTLVAGPDLDTLLGLSTSDWAYTEVIILSR